jgi:hypothetical protein
MTGDEDWRLRGQEKYLQGAQLTWRSWKQRRPNWDHGHCEFCFAKFCDERIPDALKEGYCTKDEYRWICKQCFKDFAQKFGWIVNEFENS